MKKREYIRANDETAWMLVPNATMVIMRRFVCIYGGMIEGLGRYLRPAHVYFFTEEQALKTSDEERIAWIGVSNKRGFRPAGRRWYADTTTEGVRDDHIRYQLIPLGIMKKLPDVPITSSRPIMCLCSEFAELFEPSVEPARLRERMELWRLKHLAPATLQRMALRCETSACIERRRTYRDGGRHAQKNLRRTFQRIKCLERGQAP